MILCHTLNTGLECLQLDGKPILSQLHLFEFLCNVKLASPVFDVELPFRADMAAYAYVLINPFCTLTSGYGRSESGFAMVHMSNGANVHVRFLTFEDHI